jgi:hemoglobin
MVVTVVRWTMVMALGGILMACASAPEPRTLWDRLGGEPAVTVVVDDFIANVAADPVINQRFARTDMSKLKKLLVEQICEATGGGCKYTGRTMRESHRGQKVTAAEFNAMGGDMLKSLEKFKVPQREKDELMALLGSMSPEIVGQ